MALSTTEMPVMNDGEAAMAGDPIFSRLLTFLDTYEITAFV